MNRTTTLTALAALLALGVASAQTRVYVTPGGAGTQDGMSWANAASDLAAVMASAAPNTEIWVAQGTYTPTTCAGSPCTLAERQETFELRPGVTVIGGFLGTETSADDADPSRVTLLSGAIDGSATPEENSLTIVTCEACGDAAELRNFHVAYGNADVTTGFDEGNRFAGGLLLDGRNGTGEASPTVTDCTIRNNSALVAGGGVYVSAFGQPANPGQAEPLFVRTTIRDNTAIGDGAGVYIAAGGTNTADVLFESSQIVGNVTEYDFNGPGSRGAGGGIFLNADPGADADLTLRRTLLAGNVADFEFTSGEGALVGNDGGNGGGLYVASGNNQTTRMELDNVVVRENQSFAGAGIYVNGAQLFIRNATIVDNSARGQQGNGGGIYVNGADAGVTAEVYNSIVYGNTEIVAGNGSEVLNLVNADAYFEYTLVDKADCDSGVRSDESDIANYDNSDPAKQSSLTCGPGMLYNQDPLLAASGLPELTTGSPAIDAGDDAEAPAGPDYLGNARVDGMAVDLGAFEFGAAPLPVELLAFDAEPADASVEVAWSVGQEIDLAGYRLERSTDGVAFAEVLFAPALGYGAYRYSDLAVVAGATYYYRLASVELDGTTAYSDVVAAAFAGADQLATLASRLYPNPAADALTVELAPRPEARTVYASVLDARGRRVALWPLVSDGLHRLDLSDLPAGAYVIRLTEGDRVQTSPLTITR